MYCPRHHAWLKRLTHTWAGQEKQNSACLGNVATACAQSCERTSFHTCRFNANAKPRTLLREPATVATARAPSSGRTLTPRRAMIACSLCADACVHAGRMVLIGRRSHHYGWIPSYPLRIALLPSVRAGPMALIGRRSYRYGWLPSYPLRIALLPLASPEQRLNPRSTCMIRQCSTNTRPNGLYDPIHAATLIGDCLRSKRLAHHEQ